MEQNTHTKEKKEGPNKVQQCQQQGLAAPPPRSRETPPPPLGSPWLLPRNG